MIPFEQVWYVKYMNNLVTLDTLNKLVSAGKLDAVKVAEWFEERQQKYGYLYKWGSNNSVIFEEERL